MAWYDPISVIINLATKKPTSSQWYAAFQALIDKIQGLTLESLQRSDTTTNNADTTMHGMMPKCDGIVTHFYRSDGTRAVPPGGIGLGGTTGSVDAAILVADGEDTDTLTGSGVTIATTLADNDTTVPTGKAVQDALDSALSTKIDGPASAVDGDIPVFDQTTGTIVKDSGTSLSALLSTLSGKAPLASPVLTGVPEAPTAANGTDTDQIATTKFVKNTFAYLDALIYKGATDCSGNPNYPAADAGHTYKVSVAGKIGGASGIAVLVGEMYICCVDGSAAGDQATVGANWNVIRTNLDGVVMGPASATTDHLAVFDGTTGNLIKDGGAVPSAGITAKLYSAGTAVTLVSHATEHSLSMQYAFFWFVLPLDVAIGSTLTCTVEMHTTTQDPGHYNRTSPVFDLPEEAAFAGATPGNPVSSSTTTSYTPYSFTFVVKSHTLNIIWALSSYTSGYPWYIKNIVISGAANPTIVSPSGVYIGYKTSS